MTVQFKITSRRKLRASVEGVAARVVPSGDEEEPGSRDSFSFIDSLVLRRAAFPITPLSAVDRPG